MVQGEENDRLVKEPRCVCCGWMMPDLSTRMEPFCTLISLQEGAHLPTVWPADRAVNMFANRRGKKGVSGWFSPATLSWRVRLSLFSGVPGPRVSFLLSFLQTRYSRPQGKWVFNALTIMITGHKLKILGQSEVLPARGFTWPQTTFSIKIQRNRKKN